MSSKSEQRDCHCTGKRHAETQGRKHDPKVAVRSQEVECRACGHESQEAEYHDEEEGVAESIHTARRQGVGATGVRYPDGNSRGRNEECANVSRRNKTNLECSPHFVVPTWMNCITRTPNIPMSSAEVRSVEASAR